MLSYPFLVRAFVVGVLVSLCAALLGTSLVLKRFSMIGDGLSHVGFGALAVASALGVAPLAVAVPVVVAAAVLLLRVSQSGRVRGDAAVALISSGALAVGVLVISLTSGVNTNVSNYMFGSILTISRSDAVLSVALCAAVLAVFTLFYPRIFAVTFDETFARATGTRAEGYNLLLAILTAVTVVLGMRMMGALLISSLMIFPALSAMRVFRSFRAVTVCSAVLAVCCFAAGMTASYALETPSADMGEEGKRKKRIAAGGLQSVWRLRKLLNPFRYGVLWFQYVSHRVLRWTLTPVVLVALLPLNVALLWSGHPTLYAVTLGLQCAFYLAALAGRALERSGRRSRLLFIPYYFLFMNLNVFRGTAYLATHRGRGAWEKAKRA